MAARSNALLSALQGIVRQHPKLSAGLAFQLGVAVGAFVKTARGKMIARGGAGSAAKLIEAVPVLKSALPARTKKRKPASRKRKTVRRAAA